MTEQQIRQGVVDIMASWVGCVQGDATHKYIIDTYNTIVPLPSGYKMTYTDAWCAASVSAAGYLAGCQQVVLPQMNCGSMVDLYKAAGRWVENDAYVPSPGDLVIFYWSDNGIGDCTSHASHVGMVEWCDGKKFGTIEGNMVKDGVHYCGRRTVNVNAQYIRGFCCPDYAALASPEKWYRTLAVLKADEWNAKYYVPTIEKLLASGKLKGRGGSGDATIIDLSEEAVRMYVTNDRAGLYDK